jgi:hypothetical protein
MSTWVRFRASPDLLYLLSGGYAEEAEGACSRNRMGWSKNIRISWRSVLVLTSTLSAGLDLF